MSSSGREKVTELLRLASGGDALAQEELFTTVYEELRRAARIAMRSERKNHTLQPTALVHEVFVRLVGDSVPWVNRAHFFAVVARTMRRILVDHARALSAQKRDAGVRVDDPDFCLITPERGPEIIALDEAIAKYETISPRACRVVELLFFAGFTVAETADMLGVASKTVQRDWKNARAWLHAELDTPPPEVDQASNV